MNVPTPDVSVIIPTHNRIQMLEEALASALSQEFDGTFEIIVVDDCSHDGTPRTVGEKYPKVRLVCLPQRVKNYAARNQGILTAKGRYIAFLDDDDLWEKNYLQEQIHALENQEKSFGVSGLVTWDVGTNEKQMSNQKPNLKKFPTLLHHLLVVNFITTLSTIVFPKQLFAEVGLFDESYKFGGDAELYTRCLMAGYQPVFTEKPLAIHRIHSNGQMTDAGNLIMRKKSRFERVGKLYPSIAEHFDIAPLRQIYAEIHASYAYKFFTKKLYKQWIFSSLACARYGSPRFAVATMARHLKSALKKKLK